MNLSSLLNNRAFLVDSTFRDDSVLNKEFLQRCLRDSKIDDTILDISIVSEENNYDSYEIQTSEGRFFRLKISEDPDSGYGKAILLQRIKDYSFNFSVSRFN